MTTPTINPYQTVSAVAVGADAVATLPAVTFRQSLIGLTVGAPRNASVKVYLGYIAPSAIIDQNPNGWSNTADYPNPRPIPPGQSVIVVWPGQGPSANQCSASFAIQAG